MLAMSHRVSYAAPFMLPLKLACRAGKPSCTSAHSGALRESDGILRDAEGVTQPYILVQHAGLDFPIQPSADTQGWGGGKKKRISAAHS